MQDSLFYVFAALTLVSALAVVACRNPVNSVMALLLALGGVAANFFLLEAPFLGVLLLFVHAGAAVALFLFVMTLSNGGHYAKRPIPWRRVVAGAVLLVALGGAGLCLGLKGLPAASLSNSPAPVASSANAYATGAKAYGRSLFTKYMLPVQIAGLLLLTSIVGVVVLGKRQRPPQP